MKPDHNFAILAGYDYYPCGGFNDYLTHGTLQECKDALASSTNGFDWAQIVDLNTLQVINWRMGTDWSAWNQVSYEA